MRKHCGSKIEPRGILFIVEKKISPVYQCRGSKIQKDKKKTWRAGPGSHPGRGVTGLMEPGFWLIFIISGLLTGGLEMTKKELYEPH